MRIKTVYGTASVVVSATDPAGNGVELKDAQVAVDSTGRANDVLRRIQVRAPINSGIVLPEFALQSGDAICKRLTVNGGSATDTDCGIN